MGEICYLYGKWEMIVSDRVNGRGKWEIGKLGMEIFTVGVEMN